MKNINICNETKSINRENKELFLKCLFNLEMQGKSNNQELVFVYPKIND